MKELDFEIDKLTHSIENVVTGDSFPTEVLPLSKPDLLHITKKNGWKFDWKKEYLQPDRDVFKLIIPQQSEIIQGLVSTSKEEGYVMMNLIESAPINFGENKKYYGVAGNLVAFVCQLSKEYGFDGEILFFSKTKLIEHYEKTLGAVHIGGHRMIIYEQEAQQLIRKYFPNFYFK
ncbi:MAG: hypothetical protein FWC39_04830 [Bacteroidetes bacterium]|nr:hypothetical protein [Bacteroidota bacterium]